MTAQRDGGSGLGIVKDDRPLRVAGDVFRIGLLRRSAQGLPNDCLVLGTDMGVKDIGDCDGALFTMAQLAILLVGQHFVAIAGVEVRNLAYRSRFESAVRIARIPLYYARVTGVPGLDLGPIRESVAYLMACGVDYEFRTTAVKGLHLPEDFEGIGRWIAGAREYYIQGFKDSGDLIAAQGLSEFSEAEMQRLGGPMCPP